jgi:hypothetical protein
MATMMKKTPRKATTRVMAKGKARKPAHVTLYNKTLIVNLVGQNPSDIQAVAQTFHAMHHAMISGGKAKRKVTVTVESDVPRKIFDGIISPETPTGFNWDINGTVTNKKPS